MTDLSERHRQLLADAVVAAAAARRLAQVARNLGLQAVPAEALAAVAAWPLSSAGELSARLGLTAAKLSDALKVLRRNGFVEEAADDRDRRVRRYRLTPAGVTLALRLASAGPQPPKQARG